MASSLVIKVNYGDMLRRFNAQIDESGHLDMDIKKLRAMICGFFNFCPDDEFTLTYVDEDGDKVGLVDDADLINVMTQRLKFLRIDVHLKNEKAFKYYKSSGSCSPLRSPKPHQLRALSGLLESLKSIPEPLSDSLTKLTLDLAGKATTSSSVVSDIVDCVSKVGQLCVNSSSQSQLNSEGGPCENPLSNSENSNLNASTNASTPVEVLKHTSKASSSKTNQGVEIGDGDGPDGNANSPPMPTFCDLSFLDHTAADSSQVSEAPHQGKKPSDSDNHKEMKSAGLATAGFGSSGPTRIGKSIPVDTSLSAVNSECPFSGVPIGPFPTDSAAPQLPSVVPHRIFPAKRSNNHNDAIAGALHMGVLCDGCGVNPITGPRYMSKWRYNYDLCSSCFTKMGNEGDYIKFVQPFKHSYPSKVQNIWAPGPTENNLLRGFGLKPQTKLDGRFIADVTVIDGTIMGPSTQFTKIWRMRNSGSFVWPQGTQIVWIGGDRFSYGDCVELEVPAEGVPMNGELDIAVDFIAPQYPGIYTSYWRMASPTGQKFGQRVWVLIQVHENLNMSFQPVKSGDLLSLCSADNTQPIAPKVNEDAKVHAPLKVDGVFGNYWDTNLDLPVGISKSKGPEIDNASVQPVTDVNLSKPCDVNRATQAIKPMVEGKSKDKDTKGSTIWNSTPLDASGAIKYPKLDISTHMLINETNPISSNAVCSQGVNGNDSVEEKLLRNLEEMGFLDVDLNKKILRQNDHDLEQSLNALCTINQWDPILNELELMGFTDKEMNMRLLMKNNGSIKLVVLDLLTAEKA